MIEAAKVEEVSETHQELTRRGYDPEKCYVLSATQIETFGIPRFNVEFEPEIELEDGSILSKKDQAERSIPAEACKRKWWLQWPQRMPKFEDKAKSFGTTTHSVCERFLLADDQGYGPDGKPAILYPKGWDKDVSPYDSDLIQKLVALAIEEGVLRRPKGRKVEHKFLLHLVDLESPEGITHVFVKGSIDLCSPEELLIEDHKTTSDMKYAKSANALKTNVQMLIYANALLLEWELDPPDDVEISLAHNVFLKKREAPRVRKTQTTQTVGNVRKFWRELVEHAADMVAVAQAAPTEDDWRDVPAARVGSVACAAYRGCPFVRICAGVDTPAQCREKQLKRAAAVVSPLADALDALARGKKNPEKKMTTPTTAAPKKPSLISALAAPQGVNGKPAAPKPPAPPAAKAPPKPAPKARKFWISPAEGADLVLKTEAEIREFAATQTEDFHVCEDGTETWVEVTKLGMTLAAPEAPSEEPQNDATETAAEDAAATGFAKTPPPWAHAECKSCGGSGFGSKGGPCHPCDNTAVTRGVPHSGEFDITTDGEGNVVWAKLEGGEATKAPLPSAAPKPRVSKAKATTPPLAPAAPEPQDASAEEPAPEAPTEETPAPAAQPAKRGVGRPRKGFTLLIGCAITKSNGDKSQRLEKILDMVGAAMASESRVASFSDLDPWKRREALASRVQGILEAIGTDMVVAEGPRFGPDLQALLEALMPHAGTVIRGLS